MASQIKTIGINGIEGYVVDVQVKVLGGPFTMNIVGLGDVAVKEARDRIESALVHMNMKFPRKKIIVNLAPSEIKKTGTSYDLPILIGLLLETKQLEPIDLNLKEVVFIGEVDLNGELNNSRGILPMVVEAKRRGFKRVVLPLNSLKEATMVKDIELLAFENIEAVIKWIEKSIYQTKMVVESSHQENRLKMNYSDVKGHEHMLKYVALAAAGNHNMLMIGPPGCGKSMISKRLPTILPPLSEDEALEVMAIHSVAGTLKHDMSKLTRPFRSPHYNTSPSAIIGGGSYAMPGEISLAHNGVLFLDEFPEFTRQTLESLRQPLEDKKVTISRVKQTNTFPANFILIAAMNPCPCGYLGSTKCSCTPFEIKKYRQRISGPIYDRIDIQKYLSPVNLFDTSVHSSKVTSEQMSMRVAKARAMQSERFKNERIRTNSQMDAAEIAK
ncbi:MAG TPA: magnesium chelatase, partial [Clostridiales bacterium UBA8960]|nr:magnesium chelatase [Clostridiales bacterium UBA8960]